MRIETKVSRWENKTLRCRVKPAADRSGQALYAVGCLPSSTNMLRKRNVNTLLRGRIVYSILYSGRGRPGGSWKIVAGGCCSQNAPAKFAQFFRVTTFLPQSSHSVRFYPKTPSFRNFLTARQALPQMTPSSTTRTNRTSTSTIPHVSTQGRPFFKSSTVA